jgi:hypothetical protein
MSVLLSVISGALTSLAPEALKLWNRKNEMKHKKEMMEITSKIDAERFDHDKYIAELSALVDEGKSIRDHDSSVDGGKFINAVRASVRPFITYLFFFVFVFIKAVGVWLIFNNNGGFVDMSIAWSDIYPLVWGEPEQNIFAAIMGFWFGSRAIDQTKRIKRGRNGR